MNRSKIGVVQKPSKNFHMTGEIKVSRQTDHNISHYEPGNSTYQMHNVLATERKE
jgi:hypothetical protein